MALWLGIILLVFAVYVLMGRKNRKLPPGPIGLPMFGYYFSLRKKPLETLNRLAEKYGNIVGFYVGPKYLVVLNDWDSVKDAFSQKVALDRPNSLFLKYPYKFGFGGTNGKEWADIRHLVSKAMKDSLQRNQWEDIIQLESSNLIELIAKEGEKPIGIHSVLGESLSRLMAHLFANQPKTEYSTVKMINRSSGFMDESLRILQMINFSIPLTVLLWMVGLEEIPPIIEKTRDFVKFVSDAVDSNKHTRSSEATDSFVSRLQDEVENYKKVQGSILTSEDILKGSIITLIVAGHETTKASIVWALIAMVDHPDKQNKVHEELDRVIGKNGSIRWSERSLIPYTLAALLESMRWKTIALTMRITSQDTQIGGYYVPKGTHILANLPSLHKDTRYWKDPELFMPERFLLEEGRKVNMAAESFSPFSYGKRSCPGKFLALMDMLHYFTAIMQRFKVVPKEGDKVKYKGIMTITYQTRDAELRFIPR